jgi:hypothetical protein
MSKIRKLQIATTVFEQVDYFENMDMVGILYQDKIPEAYKFKERLIIFNYNIDVYELDRKYMVNVRHVGLFQLM